MNYERELKKKKVIIFSTAYWPLVGGAEVAVKEITYRLADICDFYLVTAKIRKDLPSHEKVGKVDVYRVGFGINADKYLLPFLGVFRALTIIGEGGEEKPLIWAIMASYGGLGALFLKILRPKWPFLLTLQEGDSEAHILKRVGIFYPLWRQIFRRADYAQAISEYLKDFAMRQGVKCPVEVVPNGVNNDYVSSYKRDYTEENKRYFRSRLGIHNGNEKIVLTVSRLVEKNGVDVLIEAISNLDKMDSRPTPSRGQAFRGNDKLRVKLVIVGDGEERDNLKRLARDLKLEDRVIFAGEVKPEKVVHYLLAADVFVRLSRSEGFGNVFIEAMAAECPVVATKVGGIVDFARDGENTLLVASEDAAGAAEAIEKILENKELADKLREGGLKTAEEYDWKNISAKMGKIFSEMTNYGLDSRLRGNDKREGMDSRPPLSRGQAFCGNDREKRNRFMDEGERKKKIVIATGIWPPEVGGPATYAYKMSSRLVEKGWGVKIITYGDGGDIKILNPKSGVQKRELDSSLRWNDRRGSGNNKTEVIRVSRGWPKGIRHFIYFWKVLVNSWGAEAIYALDATAAGAPAAVAAMVLRKKFLIRIGGDLLWERAAESSRFSGSMDDFYESGFYKSFRPFIFKAVRFVLGRAGVIFITAENMREIYEKYYGIEKDKIKILPNVLNERLEIRSEKLEVRSDREKKILFAGRFVKYKNLERLIGIISNLNKMDSRIRGNDRGGSRNDRKVRLVMVGEGPEREALERKVESLSFDSAQDISLKDEVEIRGAVSKEELKRLIVESDLGVALAWTEYNPNFILECLAAGTPVLVSKGNGLTVKLPEMFLADPFSEEEIEKKMIEILENQEEAEKEVKKLSFGYSWEDSINDFISGLQKI